MTDISEDRFVQEFTEAARLLTEAKAALRAAEAAHIDGTSQAQVKAVIDARGLFTQRIRLARTALQRCAHVPPAALNALLAATGYRVGA